MLRVALRGWIRAVAGDPRECGSVPGMSTPVLLRPVTAEDLDAFEEFVGPDGTGPFQWFGYTPLHQVRRRFAENGLIDADGGTLTVVADGEVAGRVQWFPASWGRPATSSCWEIAIGLRPGYRGRGIGTLAQRQLAVHLFLHTRAQRVQASTDLGNIAEQRALEKAGFTREGVIRSAQWRQGRWHDQVLHSTLRPEKLVSQPVPEPARNRCGRR
jgi:RimJ/RimL family protein N-acetyltransferase